jgi:hypothetical protein
VFPASAVGRLRYWLQVIRIHARRVATQVIENKNGGDGSAMAHPRLAMSQVASGNRNAAKHPPVSVDVQTSVPYPAWGSVPAVDDIPRSTKASSSHGRPRIERARRERIRDEASSPWRCWSSARIRTCKARKGSAVYDPAVPRWPP